MGKKSKNHDKHRLVTIEFEGKSVVSDISTDDGRNWRALKPSASEPSDADQHWNALSLPFVVGPHGRVGKLRPDALHPAPKGAER